MHTPGHVGIALLLYAPVGTVLALVVDPRIALAGGVTAVGAAPLPDLDEWSPLPHRGPTHSIPSILSLSALVALGSGALAGMAGSEPVLLGAVCGGTALLSLSSHLVADSLTPMGIWPFWPLSSRHVSLNIVPSAHAPLNWALFLAGVTMTLLAAGMLVVLGAFGP